MDGSWGAPGADPQGEAYTCSGGVGEDAPDTGPASSLCHVLRALPLLPLR